MIYIYKNIYNSNNYLKLFYFILLFLSPIIYFIYVNKYTLNIPWEDDYDAILSFLCNTKKTNGFDNLSLYLSQQNEHRILSSTIIFSLYDHIFGTINFRGLILIGNL